MEELKQKGLDNVNREMEELSKIRFFGESGIEAYVSTIKGELKMMRVLGLIDRREQFRIRERLMSIADAKKGEL